MFDENLVLQVLQQRKACNRQSHLLHCLQAGTIHFYICILHMYTHLHTYNYTVQAQMHPICSTTHSIVRVSQLTI